MAPHRASAELSGTPANKSSAAVRPPSAAARAPRDRRKPVLFSFLNRSEEKNGESIRRAHRLHRTPDRRRRHLHPQQRRGLEEPAHQHPCNSMALLTGTPGARQNPGTHKRRRICDGNLQDRRIRDRCPFGAGGRLWSSNCPSNSAAATMPSRSGLPSGNSTCACRAISNSRSASATIVVSSAPRALRSDQSMADSPLMLEPCDKLIIQGISHNNG